MARPSSWKSLLLLGLLLILPALPAWSRAPLAPDKVLQQLVAGHDRYLRHHHKSGVLASADRRRQVAMKQAPIAIVLTCSDSRVVPEFILDQRLGDLFVVRVAGNTLDPMVLGSMEYAADHFGTSLILVLGHKRCGAVIAAVEAEGEPEGNVGSILANILPAVEQAKATCGAEAGPKLVDCAVEQNVRMVVKQIPEQSPLLAQLVKEGKLKIQGANYDLDDDSLTLYPEVLLPS